MDIEVKYINVRKDDFEDLVLDCYYEGADAGLLRSGDRGRWTLYIRQMLYLSKGLEKASKWFASIMDKKEIEQVVVGGFAAIPLLGGILTHSKCCQNGAFVRDYRKRYGFEEIIEGSINKNKDILVVDDVFNTGAACINMLDTIKREGISMDRVQIAVLAHFVRSNNSGEMDLKKAGIKHKLIKAMEIIQK